MSGGKSSKDVRVSGNVFDGLLAYLLRAVGEVATAEMLTDSEVDHDLDGPSPAWLRGRDLNRLVDLAERRLGEPELGRRTGEEMFRLRPDAYPFYQAEGSVAGGVKQAVALGSRSRTDPPFEFVEESDTHLVVKAHNRRSTRFACGVSLGYWSQVPSLFGTVGAAIEPKCITRGDDHCEFHVTWDPVEPDAGDRLEKRSRSLGDSLVSRFEELLDLASDLTAQPTIDDLLQTIADRTVSAVLTLGAVVGVRFTPNEPLMVGWSGISQTRAEELAHAADMGLLDDPTLGVAPLASARQHYGHLIAATPPGVPLTPNEMRMLVSYAGHATAAIEASAALAEARTARDGAEALLSLARELTTSGSTEEIGQRIAEAVPLLVECQFATFLTLEPRSRNLTFHGSWPHPVEALGVETVSLDSARIADEVVTSGEPLFRSVEESEGLLRSLLNVAGAKSAAIAPVVIRNETVGLLVAASTERWSEATAAPIMRRLTGLADHAATALDNSSLLHAVQHQALHDGLTGLPNRRLVQDRVEHALALAERTDRWVTLLFVDLDNFKDINDRLGHAVGDQVLCEVAKRLQASVRASDTVARLGGDEFLVLLENTSGDADGARVAEQIITRLSQPIDSGSGQIEISASVGISSASGRDTTYEQLLAASDGAMYQVKRGGRNGWQVHSGGYGYS